MTKTMEPLEVIKELEGELKVARDEIAILKVIQEERDKAASRMEALTGMRLAQRDYAMLIVWHGLNDWPGDIADDVDAELTHLWNEMVKLEALDEYQELWQALIKKYPPGKPES